ncbi:MAG: hypothetical protein RML56_05245, partial [Burkholderiales bacterium]|nr:hypothetical protein [Burkholderiales bacterium]
MDPDLIRFVDINGDGVLQLAEMRIGGDLIVLMTPELAGLPYVVSGLVAAGGLAAALSTADGLLLTIANALSHDVYYKMIDPHASTKRRVTVAKTLLLMVAVLAAWVTSYKPGHILFLLSVRRSRSRCRRFSRRSCWVFSGSARTSGRGRRHRRRARRVHLLHGDHLSVVARGVRHHEAGRRVHVVQDAAD